MWLNNLLACKISVFSILIWRMSADHKQERTVCREKSVKKRDKRCAYPFTNFTTPHRAPEQTMRRKYAPGEKAETSKRRVGAP